MDLVYTHGMGYKLHTMTLFPDCESAMRAGNVLFAIAILVDVLLTFLVIKPDFSHDATVVAGKYYNICVALDYFPANYIAAIGYHFVEACWWWAAYLFVARAKVSKEEGLITREMYYFVQFGAFLFAVLSPILLLCLMRKPHIESVNSLIFHVQAFEYMIVGMAIFTFVQWTFTLQVVSKHHPNLTAYTVAVWVFIIASFLKIWYHNDTVHKWVALEHPEAATIEPWWVIVTSMPQLNDWVWVYAMPSCSSYSPLTGWSPVGDYNEEARAVGKTTSDYAPYVHVPPENEAKNLRAAKDCADAFLTGFQADFKADPQHLEEWGVSLGMVKATFEIHQEGIELIHPDLRVGLLAKPAKYDALIRLNVTTLGAARMSTRIFLPDSTPLENMLKPNLPATSIVEPGQGGKSYTPVATHEKDPHEPVPKVMDILLAEDLKEFMATKPETLAAVKNLLYKDKGTARLCNALKHLPGILGLKNKYDLCIGRIHPGEVWSKWGLFGKSYYGGLPFRLGPGCCKWGIEPRQTDDLGPGPSINLGKKTPYETFAESVRISKERLIPAATKFLHSHDAKFDFKVQVATHHSKHDLEKADAIWDEDTSPYVAVGTLTIHKGQDMQRLQREIGDGLLFDVWNCLKEHRPVGAMNNARHEVYHSHGGARMAALKQCPVLGKSGWW